MLTHTVVLLLLWAQTTCGTTYFNSYAGRYLVLSEQAYDCEIGDRGYDGTVRHNIRWTPWNPKKRYQRQLLNGNVTYNLPFNDSYWLMDTYAIWSNNQWKENAIVFSYPSKACSIIRSSLPALYRALMGDKMYGPCELQGVYQYRDLNVDLRFARYSQMPYGLYRELKMTGIGGWVAECVYYIKRFVPAAQDPA